MRILFSLLVARYSLLPLIAPPGGANKNALIPIGTSGAVIAGFRGTTQMRDALTGIASAVRNAKKAFDTRACGNGGDPA